MEQQSGTNKKFSSETVTGIRHWANGLFSFRTSRPEGFSFQAGQYVRLGLEDGDEAIWRPYSMVSAPAEKELEFYSIRVPGGRFTTLLDRIEAGAPIFVEHQVYGFMTADRFDDGQDLWMLATGTGLGPFISMLREETVWRRFPSIILVHGVRHARELAYAEELLRMQATPPVPGSRLSVLHCVTREALGSLPSGVLTGRITTLTADGTLERVAGRSLDPDTSRVMLCGNPAMIEEMRTLLRDRGMRPHRRATPGQYITENYW